MTLQVSSAIRERFEVPIEVLPRVYLTVVATSAKPAEQWQGLFNDRCEAECIQCGMRISGEGLRELSVCDPEEAMEDAKLDRLRLKYCARRSCESRFYRVQIDAESDEHWTAIRQQFEVAMPRERTKKPRKRIWVPAVSLAQAGGVATAVLCMIVLFFVVRYWIFGYRIPLVQKKNDYRVIVVPEKR